MSTSAVSDVDEGRVPVSVQNCLRRFTYLEQAVSVIVVVRRRQAFDCTYGLIRCRFEFNHPLRRLREIATESRRQQRHDLQCIRNLVDRLLDDVEITRVAVGILTAAGRPGLSAP